MKWIFVLFIIFVIYVTVVEPNILTVKRVEIRNEKMKGLRIVFASDFHFKPYERHRLARIVKKINEQNPDVIFLGGDYVNGHKKGNTLNLGTIAEGLGALKSKYGTFAVMGNHDGWQGKKDIIEAFEAAGITVLENSSRDLERFSVAGVEDLQTGNPDIEKALRGVKSPLILLSHTPDVIEDVPEGVDLLLSGHTHGGQVVLFKPLTVPSKYGTRYAYGLFETRGGKMFVTRGLGTSILPIRFNCLPEIVVVEIR